MKEPTEDYLNNIADVYHTKGYGSGYKDGQKRGYTEGWNDAINRLRVNNEICVEQMRDEQPDKRGTPNEYIIKEDK